MTNNLEVACGAMKNAHLLPIEPTFDENFCLKNTLDTSVRFLCSALLLPNNGFLGWQLFFDKKGRKTSAVFSSSKQDVTTRDYNWIFQKCETAVTSTTTLIDLYDEDRKVYRLLSSDSVESKNTNELMELEKGYYHYQDFPTPEVQDDMLSVFTETEAIIRFIVFSNEGKDDEGKDDGHGLILISIPEEMSLRMKTILSRALPRIKVKEIKKDSAKESENLWNVDLVERMADLLVALKLPTEEEATEKSEEAGIESLDLNILTLKYLKQAGIRNIEELQKKSDKELMTIKRIGKKSVAEIRKKLEVYRQQVKTALKEHESDMVSLENLIGLAGVKEQVRKITAYAKLKQDMEQNHYGRLSMAMNMEFVGNPGTAKTTVARILAGIFHEIGLLSSSNILEVGRADLVAQYVGQTSIKVKEVFKKAKGRLLFIDEAYSLVEDRNGLFGDEAINTIVQEMENNRNDTVVVFAGYPDKMKALFARNPGFRSRVPFRLIFKDYSSDEMLQITEQQAFIRGFFIASEAKEKVKTFCDVAAENPEAGNGRFCRNLVEAAILSYASRHYGGTDTVGVNYQDFVLSADDFTAPDIVKGKKESLPIGFRV